MTVEAGGPCKRCGKDPAAGFASINDDWYCHDGATGPGLGSCYEEAQSAHVSSLYEMMLADPKIRARLEEARRRSEAGKTTPDDPAEIERRLAELRAASNPDRPGR